ncbi:MAG: fumarate hydratase [Firmicutes bacterium]|nr:fumarate hydratase [Bacillota bacterium]
MRSISTGLITETVKNAFLRANYDIGADITECLEKSRREEISPLGRDILGDILLNDEIARTERIAACQDTGMAVVFAYIGQDARIEGGDFNEAVEEGVRQAYSEGYLRKSVVSDPLFDRRNTGDNTPAVIYTEIVPGDRIRFDVTAKGFGSENMSAVRMLTPAAGVEGVLDFIEETVSKAGPNPCPPLVVGVCVGGTMDKAAVLAKKATMRPVGTHNSDPRYAGLEDEALKRINKLGIGPGGFGGSTTALAVNIDFFPTHIAGLPVAVNICCHVARHASAEI